MARLSTQAISDSAGALQAGDLKAALEIRDREFGRKGGYFDAQAARTMELILSRTPTLLADCPNDVLQVLRIAAAMMELWGTNTIKDFISTSGVFAYRFNEDAIALMLHSHACFLRSLEQFRAVGINRVQLLGSRSSDDCLACREAEGQSFTIETVPELPLAACQCETGYGCRVIVTASLED